LQNPITTGNAQAWYNSSQITTLFGGQPSAQQIQSFDNAILARVQQTFSQSGVSVTLTENPNVAALHTLSLVSNTSAASLSSAIGMTRVGGSGFSFIDQSAPSAQSVDQLEWIVAHNISHELMLAFGVPENYDKTGNYIDAKLANWAMMVSPTATFSSAAAQALAQALAGQNTASSGAALGAQAINSVESTVPEPATIALWALAGAAAFAARRRRAPSRSADSAARLA
jgi:MYXO-CTERM domain-containing protein